MYARPGRYPAGHGESVGGSSAAHAHGAGEGVEMKSNQTEQTMTIRLRRPCQTNPPKGRLTTTLWADEQGSTCCDRHWGDGPRQRARRSVVSPVPRRGAVVKEKKGKTIGFTETLPGKHPFAPAL